MFRTFKIFNYHKLLNHIRKIPYHSVINLKVSFIFNECRSLMFLKKISHHICKTHKQGQSHKRGQFPQTADPTNGPKISNEFQQMGWFSPQLGRTWIIRHSHKWANSHNWAENYMSFLQMGRFYVDSRNGVMLCFRMTPIANRRKHLGSGDHYTAHVGSGNQFRATTVASEDPSDVYVLKDRNVLYYEQSDTVKMFFVHGNIVNKQTHKNQFASSQSPHDCYRGGRGSYGESAAHLAAIHKLRPHGYPDRYDWIIVGRVWEETCQRQRHLLCATEDSLPMTWRQKNRPSYGMTSDFRSICGIGPVVGIGLIVGPILVLSLTYWRLLFSKYKGTSSSITTIFVLNGTVLFPIILENDFRKYEWILNASQFSSRLNVFINMINDVESFLYMYDCYELDSMYYDDSQMVKWNYPSYTYLMECNISWHRRCLQNRLLYYIGCWKGKQDLKFYHIICQQPWICK